MTSGIRRGGNHALTSRSTLTKVIASPAPTSARASSASGELVRDREQHLAAGHHQRAGRDQPARAEPVDRDPDRDLQPGVDEQLEHGERRQDAGRGPEPLRGVDPGDREEVRCRTAMTYAASAADQTSQARLGVPVPLTAPILPRRGGAQRSGPSPGARRAGCLTD